MEYLRTTKVIRTGSSLCVVIPRDILTALKIERGDQVAFIIYDEKSLVIHKLSQEEILRINLASAGATASI